MALHEYLSSTFLMMSLMLRQPLSGSGYDALNSVFTNTC